MKNQLLDRSLANQRSLLNNQQCNPRCQPCQRNLQWKLKKTSSSNNSKTTMLKISLSSARPNSKS